jgi:hypothetical protein
MTHRRRAVLEVQRQVGARPQQPAERHGIPAVTTE